MSGSILESYGTDVLGEPAGDWNQALMDLGVIHMHDPRSSLFRLPQSLSGVLDPTVYEAPRRQSVFNGSHRQLRGALGEGPQLAGDDLHEAGRRLDRPATEVTQTIATLTEEACSPRRVFLGDVEEVLQECLALSSHDALRMKLHGSDRKIVVANSLNDTVI